MDYNFIQYIGRNILGQNFKINYIFHCRVLIVFIYKYVKQEGSLKKTDDL